MGQAGTTTDDTGNPRPDRRQKEIFLDALAESSNVAASARAARLCGSADDGGGAVPRAGA